MNDDKYITVIFNYHLEDPQNHRNILINEYKLSNLSTILFY